MFNIKQSSFVHSFFKFVELHNQLDLSTMLWVNIQGFEESVEHDTERALIGAGQELYQQIMIKRAWLDVKDLLPGTFLTGPHF